MKLEYEAVVIGVSAGGMEALEIILPSLPGDYKLPVIIVQHMHPNSDNFLAVHLNKKCQISVKEAEDKETIKAGIAYVAPPDYHLMIEEDRSFSLCISEKVNHARPAIDVLFETAADAYGSKLIGIILTGANTDGSQGLKRVKERGGLAIVQDPVSAAIDAMPRGAIAATDVDHVIPLAQIGPFLVNMVNGSGVRKRETTGIS